MSLFTSLRRWASVVRRQFIISGEVSSQAAATAVRVNRLFDVVRKDNEKHWDGQLTSGMVSLYIYWKGRNAELVMARLKRGGFVVPLLAMMCCRTDPPPADSPHIVTWVGSPPNWEIWGLDASECGGWKGKGKGKGLERLTCFWTHCKANCWST
jgi:hypothetical protein